jgi:hypothetical protein
MKHRVKEANSIGEKGTVYIDLDIFPQEKQPAAIDAVCTGGDLYDYTEEDCACNLHIWTQDWPGK